MELSNKKNLILIALDIAVFAVCWILAYSLRFGLAVPADDGLSAANNYALQLKLLIPWIVLTHLAIYWVFNLYKGIWRYAGSSELLSLGMAAGVHYVLWLAINLFFDTQSSLGAMPQGLGDDGGTYVMHVPYIVLTMYAFLANATAGGMRFSRRVLHEFAGRPGGGEDAPATLIVGAGDVADALLRDLRRSGRANMRPVCAVAEHPSRVGLRLQGIPVVGTLEKIALVIEENSIGQVLIAMDHATPESLRRVVSACEKAEVRFRIVPSLAAISEGLVETSVREVDIEDLLGRETVNLDLPADRNYLSGKVVLVTGAGGSIGSEIANQCARCGAQKIVLLGKGENSIFEVLHDLKGRYATIDAVPVIADVRDAFRMERIFVEHKPAVVFHAAAHKHVPLMEDSPDEAVKNNVIGTATVALLSEKHGAERFVLISSDKAVSPVSIMGMTKRVAELIALGLAERSRCQFAVVRFGNVMGSRGSVIPLFRRQIRQGGPVTLTHPDVTRFFMTIPEAVNLVLQAGSLGRNGALYLLDMGEPVKIRDLARNMITLSGLRPDEDIKIEYIGLRPGERLHEELLTSSEGARKTEIEKIYRAEDPTIRPWSSVEHDLQVFERLSQAGSTEELVDYIKSVVGGYTPPIETPVEQDLFPVIEASSEASKMIAEGAPPPEVALEHQADPVEESQITAQPIPETAQAASRMVAEGAPPTEVALEHQQHPIEESQITAQPIPETAQAASRMVAEGSPPTDVATEHQQHPVKEADVLAEPIPDAEQAEAEMVAEGAPTEEEALHHQEDPVSEEDLDDSGSPESRDFEEPDLFQEPEEVETVNLPVEPPADDNESAPPREEILLSEEAPTLEKEPEPTMPDTPKTPGSTLIAMRVSPGADAETLAMLIEQIKANMLGDNDALVCLVEAETAALVPDGIAKVDIAGRPGGAVLTEILKNNAHAEFLITLTSEVLLRPDAIKRFAETFHSSADTPVLYSDFSESRDGALTEVHPHEHEGCPHERFEFGPVIAYRITAIEKVGGIRQDLRFAWEYDLHLKLMEKGAFHVIHETLYTHFLPSAKGGKGGAVYSPGMGPLGGFSYVFYPEDMEKEVTSVFEEALKRRGCWIDHECAVVDHGDRQFDVMVTIVVPILNRVRFIRNAIERVQEGTYDNFEIVVIDNGSTDGTIEVVKELAAKDQRIRLIHGKGGSIASALNEGIRAARGKYIGQLDSDDQYSPHTLEKMVEYLESHPRCGLAISYYRLMDENGNVIEDIAPVTHSGYSRNQILRRDGAGATRYFAKAVLEEFGYYDEENYGNFGEDYDMVVKTGEKYEVGRVHEELYFYRRHADNTDVTRDPVMKYKNKNRARQEALRRRREINQKLGKV